MNRMFVFFFFSLTLVSSLRLIHNNHDNNSKSSVYYLSPFFPEGPIPNVTASVVVILDLFAVEWQQSDSRTIGKIGIWNGDDPPGKFREDFVRRGAFLGLVGLIGWTTWTPEHFFEIDLSPEPLTIPYVSVYKSHMDEIVSILNNNSTRSNTTTDSSVFEISLTDDSPNEWMILYESLLFKILWRAGLGSASVCLALYAAQKLYLWYVNYRTTKFYSQIAVVCLIVEFLCNIERAAFSGILGGVGGTRQVSWMVSRIALSISFPLTYLTTALTAAYIHEALTSTSPMGTMIAKTKKPLIWLTVFYIITDVPVSVASALRISSQAVLLASISGILITAGLVVTGIVLLIIAIKLRSYTKLSIQPVQANGKRGPPDRIVVLLDRVQTSTYCIFFTALASLLTQTPMFTTPLGFVSIQAGIIVGLMAVSLLHIIAYGRTPLVQEAQKEKEREKYLKMSQSNSPKPKLDKTDVGNTSNAFWEMRFSGRDRGELSSCPASRNSEEHQVTTAPPLSPSDSRYMTTAVEFSEQKPSATPESPISSSPNVMVTESAVEEKHSSKPFLGELTPTPLLSLKTLESASIVEQKLSLPPPQNLRLQTLESAPDFIPPPVQKVNAKPPTTQRAPTILITDVSQGKSSEWREQTAPPLLQRQSSFAATRKEQTGNPMLVEERGPWQVIKDGLGRTYYNNLLTRMTTWTDRTESVPPPYEELYPEGFGVAKAKATAPDTKPVLLEERGDWMAILAPTGHVYYHNKLSRMQTWSDPTAEVNDSEERRLLLDEKGNWQEILDVSGKVYYNNTLTRQRTWTTPEEMLENTSD